MNKAVFLDRDGVINLKAAEGEYINSWDEVVILPGVEEAIRKLHDANYRIIVVTNQRGIAKGKITFSGLNQIHQKLISRLAGQGAVIDRIYYCPHDLDQKCDCRKPAAGMLMRAVSEIGIDIGTSWMVGDSLVDILAGRAAGCRTVMLSRESARAFSTQGADIEVETLLQATEKILLLDSISLPKFRHSSSTALGD